MPLTREYIIESMRHATEQKQKGEASCCHLEPNRIPTDAEAELFAELFNVDLGEARTILCGRVDYKSSDNDLTEIEKCNIIALPSGLSGARFHQ